MAFRGLEGEEPLGRVACDAVANLADLGIVAAVRRLVTTDAAASLIEVAGTSESAILVVAAPRSPGRVTHWFATARRLIRYAPCPVLVVPSDTD